jgi:transposase
MKPLSLDLRQRIVFAYESGEGSYEEIGHRFYVSDRVVGKLVRQYRSSGSLANGLHRRGRKRRLNSDDDKRLVDLLQRGATSHGWPNDIWTARRVREVIAREFGVHYSHKHVWTILRTRLRWSPQKPTTRLRERDEETIADWRKEEFRRIKEDTFARGAYLVFVDEAGFMLMPVLRRTFAPMGSRPFTAVSDPHGRISTICAITISPCQKKYNLLFQMLPDNKNFTGKTVAGFLHTLQRLPAPFTLVWDSIPIHSAKPVREYLQRNPKVKLEMIPEYAPELNPADGVWSYVKYGRLANYAPCDLKTLRRQVKTELSRLKRRGDLLSSFIRKSKLTI